MDGYSLYVLNKDSPLILIDPTGRKSVNYEEGNHPTEVKEVIHIVESGDTYSEIAEQYGVTVDQLREWNEYEDTKIPIGAEVKIKLNSSLSGNYNTDQIDSKNQQKTNTDKKVEEEEESFFKNKSIEFNGSLAILGGFGYGIGLVFDNEGEWAIYGNLKGIFGLAEGFGINITEIKSTTDQPWDIEKDFSGKSVSYNFEMPFVTLSEGGNSNTDDKGKNPTGIKVFTDYGDKYTTSSLSVDPTKNPFKIPSNLKGSVKLSVDISHTFIWYKSNPNPKK